MSHIKHYAKTMAQHAAQRIIKVRKYKLKRSQRRESLLRDACLILACGYVTKLN